MPGVGAQGGAIEPVLAARAGRRGTGGRRRGRGLLVNVSRGIAGAAVEAAPAIQASASRPPPPNGLEDSLCYPAAAVRPSEGPCTCRTSGPPELIIILVIALLILGPGKLPEVGASIGKSIREFRKASSDLERLGQGRYVATAAARTRPRARPGRHPRALTPGRTRPSSTPDRRQRATPARTRPRVARPRWPTPTPCATPPRRASPLTPDRSTAPPAPPTGRSCRWSIISASCGRGCSACILAVAAGSLVGFYFARDDPQLALAATARTATAQVLGPGDAFAIQLRISIVVGIILAMPVLLYQIWAFVAPGLTPAERRTVRPWVPLALVFFALGVGIACFVLPVRWQFLLSFTDDKLVANIAAGPYFDFVTTMFLAFGLVMEFPILLVGLSRVGILTSRAADRRRDAT